MRSCRREGEVLENGGRKTAAILPVKEQTAAWESMQVPFMEDTHAIIAEVVIFFSNGITRFCFVSVRTALHMSTINRAAVYISTVSP